MLEQKKLISVIIPVYKVEKYIKRCLDSIINQTYKNLEIILIDDGSPDLSGEICDEYAKKDSRIKVIHKENGGVASARNLGIDISTGDYIAFVDSDDWIELDMYEKMFELAEKNNVDIVRCSELIEYGTSIKKGNTIYTTDTFLDMENKRYDILEKIINEGVLPSIFLMLIKRELIEKNKIRFDTKLIIGEDLVFVLNLICNANIIYTYNKFFYHYFIHSQSAMNSDEKNERNANNLLLLYENIVALLNKYNLYDFKMEECVARYIFYRIYSRISKAVILKKEKNIIERFLDNNLYNSIIEKVDEKKLSLWGKIFYRLSKKRKIFFYYNYCFIYEGIKSLVN